jgi:hypothetical protein
MNCQHVLEVLDYIFDLVRRRAEMELHNKIVLRGNNLTSVKLYFFLMIHSQLFNVMEQTPC